MVALLHSQQILATTTAHNASMQSLAAITMLPSQITTPQIASIGDSFAADYTS